MKRIFLSVATAMVTVLAARVCAEGVSLVSNRSAKADVSAVGGGTALRVEVSFLAVSTLAEASNERISRLMAQSFAQRAISSFLKAQKTVSFSLARTLRCDFSKGDGRCTVVYEIPRSAISDAETHVAASKGSTAAWAMFRKACDSESKYALDDFRSSCNGDLRLAEAAFLLDIESGERSAEALRREIKAAFSSMRDRANADDMLLMSEKDELIEKIDSTRNYLLKKLNGADSALQTAEGRCENERLLRNGMFSSARYKGLLLSDEVLLTTGGCRFFVVEGKTHVVAVGCTEVRDDSARDRIRRKEVAEEKARSEVVKSKRTDVSYFSKSSSRSSVTYRNADEQSEEAVEQFQTTTMSASDYVDSMKTVGTWYSEDGKLFFLALGCECTGE